MEKQRVEEPFARQFQEIVAVEGRPVIEFDADVARRGMQQDLGPLLLAGLAAGGDEHCGHCGRRDPGKQRFFLHTPFWFYLCRNARSIAPTSIRSRRTR